MIGLKGGASSQWASLGKSATWKWNMHTVGERQKKRLKKFKNIINN